jgi:eukaryotic-like serine/threonine-protein kinase
MPPGIQPTKQARDLVFYVMAKASHSPTESAGRPPHNQGPVSIQPGTQLGPYEVQEFIGQGAMGFVYKAYHAQLERTGAVKVLQGIAVGPDAVVRFRHEAQAIAQMRHPNIVNVYDFGEFDGTPYMIVEYVPGGSLAGKMTQAALDPQVALRYLRGIAAGLDYAHSLGIVHRDVKPANVLLEKDGTPVIADFGLVKLLQGSSLQSMSGVTTGTPAYMAPEQVMGRQVGPASDRYSLATMAYEMLTGAIPFEGDGVLELMYAHVHRDPPPPSSRNAAMTLSVDAVIMRGLAKDPQARWESCEAFVTALSAALAGAPAPAVDKTIAFASPLASTVPVAAAVSPDTRPGLRTPDSRSAAATVVEALPVVVAPTLAAPPAAEHRSRRWRWIGAAAGVVILLLLLSLCAIAALKPSISLSANPVHAGDTVVVTGTHLPANQVGEVQLWSALRTFPFRADSNGNISVQMLVPRDIHLGDHLVKLCWSNACHVQTTLTVTSPVALVTSTPSPSSSASSSPSSTPTSSPSATPHPTPSTAPGPSNNPSPISNPTPTPTRPPPPPPTPTPTPPPPPPPSPTPNPCPTSSQAAVLTQPAATLILPATVPVAGQNFTPNKQVTVTYSIGGKIQTATTTVTCGGTFSTSFTAGSLLGTGTVTATDSAGRTASKTFTIVL